MAPTLIYLSLWLLWYDLCSLWLMSICHRISWRFNLMARPARRFSNLNGVSATKLLNFILSGLKLYCVLDAKLSWRFMYSQYDMMPANGSCSLAFFWKPFHNFFHQASQLTICHALNIRCAHYSVCLVSYALHDADKFLWNKYHDIFEAFFLLKLLSASRLHFQACLSKISST